MQLQSGEKCKHQMADKCMNNNIIYVYPMFGATMCVWLCINRQKDRQIDRQTEGPEDEKHRLCV